MQAAGIQAPFRTVSARSLNSSPLLALLLDLAVTVHVVACGLHAVWLRHDPLRD